MFCYCLTDKLIYAVSHILSLVLVLSGWKIVKYFTRGIRVLVVLPQAQYSPWEVKISYKSFLKPN